MYKRKRRQTFYYVIPKPPKRRTLKTVTRNPKSLFELASVKVSLAHVPEQLHHDVLKVWRNEHKVRFERCVSSIQRMLYQVTRPRPEDSFTLGPGPDIALWQRQHMFESIQI